MLGILDGGAPANFTSTLYQQRARRLRASAEWSAFVRPVVDTARRRGWAARCRVGQCNECLVHARARAEYARRGPGDQRCDMQFVVAWARCSIALATSVSQLGLGVSLRANAWICVRLLSLLLWVHGGCSEWRLGWHKLRQVVVYVGPWCLAMVLCNVCFLWRVVPGLIFPLFVICRAPARLSQCQRSLPAWDLSGFRHAHSMPCIVAALPFVMPDIFFG